MMTHICVFIVEGFESPGEWEDHSRIFGLDGPDIHYTVSNRYLYFIFSCLAITSFFFLMVLIISLDLGCSK